MSRSGSGTSGSGGRRSRRMIEVSSSGASCGPLAVGVQDLRAGGRGPEQRAGVDLGQLEQVELDRRHGAEAAAAAAQRPEQVRVGVRVDAARLAVGGHELDRAHAVAGQALASREPADAAAERVADDAGVGRGAVQRRKAVLAGRGHDVAPERARLGPRAARLGIDLDAGHAGGLEQQRAVERAERKRAVAGALQRDAHPGATGEVHGRLHVRRVLRVHDGGRMLVDGEVPGHARGIPAVVGGGGHDCR